MKPLKLKVSLRSLDIKKSLQALQLKKQGKADHEVENEKSAVVAKNEQEKQEAKKPAKSKKAHKAKKKPVETAKITKKIKDIHIPKLSLKKKEEKPVKPIKTVFLYAGQGSQKVGMGKDFYDKYASYREVVDHAKLPFNWKKLMSEGPLEKLSQTEYTQPCMSLFAAGVTAVLKEKNILPDGVCGLSLGEYSALYAAGVFDVKTLIDLTAFRGKAMADAAKGLSCSMSAILGMKAEDVEEACEAVQDKGFVTVANYNCLGQYVICGDEPAVAAAEAYLKEKGMRRAVRLNVSGPFHTKYMAPAGVALKKYFENLNFGKPKVPVAMNATGDFLKAGENIGELLTKQVQSSVKFESDLRKFLEAGAENFVEIGPGNALSGFLKKTAKAMGKEINVYKVETVEDLEELEKQEVFIA